MFSSTATYAVRALAHLNLFESLSELPDCLLGRPRCDAEDPCPAHERWCRVKETYFDFLHHTSLAEIATSAVTRTAEQRQS